MPEERHALKTPFRMVYDQWDSWQVEDAGGCLIAPKLTESEAEFITSALNSHAALLAAAKSARENSQASKKEQFAGLSSEVEDQLDAAIAAAEPEGK